MCKYMWDDTSYMHQPLHIQHCIGMAKNSCYAFVWGRLELIYVDTKVDLCTHIWHGDCMGRPPNVSISHMPYTQWNTELFQYQQAYWYAYMSTCTHESVINYMYLYLIMSSFRLFFFSHYFSLIHECSSATKREQSDHALCTKMIPVIMTPRIQFKHSNSQGASCEK